MGQTARPGFLGQIGQDPESLEDDNEDDVDVSAAAAAVVWRGWSQIRALDSKSPVKTEDDDRLFLFEFFFRSYVSVSFQISESDFRWHEIACIQIIKTW